VTLIHNPGAGKQRSNDAEQLVAMLRAAGHAVRYQSCEDECWHDALEEHADLIAVAGGDGTVARVAKRAADLGVPVGPLPSGTANNISRSLGLVEKPFEELVRSWPQARRVKLDIGVADGPWGRRYFVEGIGMGVFARLLAGRMSGRKRRMLKGKRPEERVDDALTRLQQRARRMKPLALEASLDGEDISGRYLLLEAINIPYVGSNLFLAPDSKPGDGHFDVVLAGEDERERLVLYLETWQQNRERLAVLPSRRGRRLSMRWTGFEMHIDDELWPDEEKPRPPARVETCIEDAAVDFLVPA